MINTVFDSLQRYMKRMYIRYLQILKFDYGITAHLEFKTLAPTEVSVAVADIYQRIPSTYIDTNMNYKPENSIFLLDAEPSPMLIHFFENSQVLNIHYHDDHTVREALVRYEDNFTGTNYVGTIHIVFYRGTEKIAFPEYYARLISPMTRKQGAMFLVNTDKLYAKSKKTATRLTNAFIQKTWNLQNSGDFSFKLHEEIYEASLIPYKKSYWQKPTSSEYDEHENIAYLDDFPIIHQLAYSGSPFSFSFLKDLFTVTSDETIDFDKLAKFTNDLAKYIVQEGYQLCAFDGTYDVYDSHTIYVLNKENNTMHELRIEKC